MQNIVLLTAVDRHSLVPGVETAHFLQAMEDLMSGTMLEKNPALFESLDLKDKISHGGCIT